MQKTFIYKILTAEEFQEFSEVGVFKGSPIDLEDGFIHASTAEQVENTRAKFFAGLANLKILKINPSGLDVRFEVSPRSGDSYPHIYEAFSMENIVEIIDPLIG